MRLSTRTDFKTERNGLDLERRKIPCSTIFELSESNPTRVGLVHEPHVLSQAFSAEENSLYRPSPRGTIKAREAIAAHVGRGIARQENGIKVDNESVSPIDPESLILCASTSEAYSYLFKLLCDPGDAVFVPRPGYPLFDHLAALEGLRTIGYPLEYLAGSGWRLDADRLESLVAADAERRIKAVVLINPNNPTGSYITEGEKLAVSRICESRGLSLIVDEVFHPYRIEPWEKTSSFYGYDRVSTFVLDGFSKRLCLPQAKLGWISVSGPKEEKEAALQGLDLISDTYLSAGTPVMNAAGSLLEREGEMVEKVLDRCQKNLRSYREILEYPGSPHQVLRCEGGWTALVRSPRFDSEEELALGLLREKGLAVQPGYFFDMEQEAFFAFSLILRPEDARWAATEYADFFKHYR
ncbi:MAG: Aminotransferase [Spirochaetes bacterium]|nr:MAG: Aminotransferase [Spirochaetota bacterium]